MKAVWIERHGGPEVLGLVDRPRPEAGPGEIRVRLRAAALNHLDLWVRRGVPGVRYPLPLVPGCDGAGVVDALGPGVTGPPPGTEVVVLPGVACGVCAACADGDDNLCRDYGILGENRDGTCAEYISVPAGNVLAKPACLGFEEAAAVSLVFLTAWHMLVVRADLRPGETALIHAAGSGVSSAGIQIARLLGARVLATAGTADKCERARTLGAHEAIPYREVDFAEEVKRLTGKRGVDVVLDHIGPDTWEANIRSLARGGRLVICGNTSGTRAETPLPHVFFKSLSLLGSTMGSRGELHTVFKLVEQGLLHPVVHAVLPLEEVARGHALLEGREVFGKVVLKL